MTKVLVLGDISDKEALQTLSLEGQGHEIIRDTKQIRNQLAQWFLYGETIPEPTFCMLVRGSVLEALVYGGFSDEQACNLLKVSVETACVRNAARARELLKDWLIYPEKEISDPIVCTEVKK